MSFFHIVPPKKKKVNGSKQSQVMTRQMERVIQGYLGRYSPSGYYTITNENLIRNISLVITPLMTGILTKYNEEDFHNVMKKRYYDENGILCWGFDYIGDIRSNHPFAFNIAMMVARSNKRKLDFDVNIGSELMIDIILSWGWRVWPHEKAAIHHMMHRIKETIQNS